MLDLHYYCCHIGQDVYVDVEVFPYPENPKTWTSKLHRQKDKNRINYYDLHDSERRESYPVVTADDYVARNAIVFNLHPLHHASSGSSRPLDAFVSIPW
jgi:hypothetical protein